MSNFVLRIQLMINTNERTFKRKQNEPIHDTPGFMAAELAAVRESF